MKTLQNNAIKLYKYNQSLVVPKYLPNTVAAEIMLILVKLNAWRFWHKLLGICFDYGQIRVFKNYSLYSYKITELQTSICFGFVFFVSF